MKTQKIIIGNWKLNPVTLKEATTTFSAIQAAVPAFKNVQTVICPPFVYISECAKFAPKLSTKRKVELGVQNVFYEPKGSFTGEISPDLVAQFGVTYAIIGHSERRKLGETDEMVNKKVLLALKSKLIPIICIGEQIRDEEGHYLGVIKDQIEKALVGVQKRFLSSIIIAYEPVWTIGAANAMNAHDVHEMMIFVKKTLVDLYKLKTISTPIIYGGAVDPLNAYGILKDGLADGLLVGRQSLAADSFTEIVKIANTI